jgi:cyclic beta-1,2-glucan synthetase
MQGEFLHLDPCIPKNWPRFEMTVRYRSTRYEIRVENPKSVTRGVFLATFDGEAITGRPVRVPLLNDDAVHRVDVTLG